MATQVLVVDGSYRDHQIQNEVFTLSRGLEALGGNKIQVKNNGSIPSSSKLVCINITDPSKVKILGTDRQSKRKPNMESNVSSFVTAENVAVKSELVPVESDEQAMDRIATRFNILDEMSLAAINGDIRALIVSGPPGVGKSFGVERQLEKSSMFDRLGGKKVRYEIVKGAITALGLYSQLYKYSDPKNVLVFDDCDSAFSDELALNILKAALDSGKRRRIFWNSDSRLLREEGIPNSFEFRGSAIFITNLNFVDVRSKKMQEHLAALQSRCHYLDLTINSERDKMLRIKQVHRDADGGLFSTYEFVGNEPSEIFEFMTTNSTSLREISLRMCLKIADLVKISPNNWKTLAKATVCK